jgi:hypothetical protein
MDPSPRDFNDDGGSTAYPSCGAKIPVLRTLNI